MDFNLNLFKMAKKAPSLKNSILRMEHSNNILNLDAPKKKKVLPKIVGSMPDNLPAIREQSEIFLKKSNPSTHDTIVKSSDSKNNNNKNNKVSKVKLPKLSKSYKFIVKNKNIQGIIKKPSDFDTIADEDLESQPGSNKKKLSIAKTGTPTKEIRFESRVSSNKSTRSSKSIKAAIKKRVSLQPNLTTTIDQFEQTSTLDQSEKIDQFESYEDFIRRINKTSDVDREASPINDSIWPSDYQQVTKKKEDPLKKLNLRIGSIFSEDANYAMLKTYEDMIYYDLISIYPETKPSNLERMKTEVFKKVPRKLTTFNEISSSEANINEIKLPEVPAPKLIVPNKLTNFKNKTDNTLPVIITKENTLGENDKLNKHKYTISRQLESAMKISDVCKKAKGQFVPLGDSLKSKNPLNEYNNWKTNWNNYILNN